MVDKYLMDEHKLIWHIDRVVDWLGNKRIAPIYIDMGITRTCNIRCKYCYYSVPENRSNDIIPTDKLIAFLREASEVGVKAIGFLGDGEPMVHPGVYDAVIEGANAGLDMAISSNGTVLKEERLEEFLAALTWIRFNISASAESYERVMGTKQKIFELVIKNIKKCVDIKKRFNFKTTIGLQMVLINECSNDIVRFAKIGKELGVDYAVIKQCSESFNHKPKLIDYDYERFAPFLYEAESYSDNNYSVIVKWRKIRNMGIRKYDRCYGCEFLLQISGNGEVYNCGNFFGNEEFYIGNISKESFRNIVFSDRYKKVMEKIKKELNVHKMCGINCRQNELNEFLWKLKNPPDHINFI